MANLDVQPKRKTIWPWLLLALIVIALVIFFVLRSNEGVNNTTVGPSPTDTSRSGATTPGR